ncbi:MAG: hypothetical protein AAF488_12095 [Planctomycetota bacterium]
MRGGTMIAGLFLVLLAVIPFVFVYWHEGSKRGGAPAGDPPLRPANAERRPDRGRSSDDPPSPSSTHDVATSAGSGAGHTTEPATVTTDRVDPPAPSAGAATFVGTLRLPGSKSAVSRQLMLRTSVGDRPVFTDETGHFSFVVPAEHFPVVVVDSQETSLFQADRYFDPTPAFINIEILRPTRRFNGLIQPKVVVAERFEDRRHRIRIYGTTDLQVGQGLYSYLYAGKKVVSSGVMSVEKKGLLADFDVPPRELHAGRFRFALAWKPSSGTPSEIQEVRSYLGIAEAEVLPGEIDARGFVYIGRPEEEAVQEKVIREYTRNAMLEVQVARDFMLYLGYQVRAKGEQPPASWRHIRSFIDSPKRQSVLGKYPPFAEDRSRWTTKNFRLKAWRELIDTTLPMRWQPYRAVEAFPYPDKYPTVAAQIPALFGELNRLSRLESRLIYEALGEGANPRDYLDLDFGLTDERRLCVGRINRMSREIIEQLELR